MDYYQTKVRRLSGITISETKRAAHVLYRQTVKSSRRRPYIRSAYFNKEKIFLDNFWPHINQKSHYEIPRRLRFLPCAIELIQFSRVKPLMTVDRHNPQDRLYRFKGLSVEGNIFYVQIKEDT